MPGKSGKRTPESYERTLIKVGKAVPEKAKIALEAVAERIVATARNIAPVVSPDSKNVNAKPGELRNAINWKWGKSRKNGFVIKISSTAAKNAKGVSYGQYAEWDPLFSKAGNKPFIYPALDAHAGEVEKAVADATREAVSKQ